MSERPPLTDAERAAGLDHLDDPWPPVTLERRFVGQPGRAWSEPYHPPKGEGGEQQLYVPAVAECESCDDTGIYEEGAEWAPCGECALGRGFAERLKSFAREHAATPQRSALEEVAEELEAQVAGLESLERGNYRDGRLSAYRSAAEMVRERASKLPSEGREDRHV